MYIDLSLDKQTEQFSIEYQKGSKILHNFALWLVQKTCTILSTNQMQN